VLVPVERDAEMIGLAGGEAGEVNRGLKTLPAVVACGRMPSSGRSRPVLDEADVGVPEDISGRFRVWTRGRLGDDGGLFTGRASPPPWYIRNRTQAVTWTSLDGNADASAAGVAEVPAEARGRDSRSRPALMIWCVPAVG